MEIVIPEIINIDAVLLPGVPATQESAEPQKKEGGVK
jgi:hypothetical protein